MRPRDENVARWIAGHPVPIHRADAAVWSERVRSELGDGALSELLELLAHGDLEQQYQAVAAVRALGAEVWADGTEPEMTWLIRLPGETDERRLRPEHQLAS
jgi:hypothetical protein